MASSDCSRQVSWICNIFLEFGMRLAPILVYIDNQGSIFIGSNPVQEIRTKHTDIKYHYMRECIADKKIELYFVPTEDNIITLLISSPKILDTSNLRGSEDGSGLSSSHNTLNLIAW
jgi:hypothetical protein